MKSTPKRKPAATAAKKKAAAKQRVIASVAKQVANDIEALLNNLPSMPVPAPVLSLNQRADATINGPRQHEYGDTLQNFAQTAMIWQGILAPKLLPGAKILPEDVGLLMMGLKMSRLSKTPDHNDSVLDIAGYAGCIDKLQLERIAEKELLGATVDFGSEIAKRYNSPD